jgi:hypothetical protein
MKMMALVAIVSLVFGAVGGAVFILTMVLLDQSSTERAEKEWLEKLRLSRLEKGDRQ